MVTTAILSIWERVLLPAGEALPPEVAGQVLRWDFPEADRRRMEELAERSGAGTITAEERAELEAFSHAAALLTVLHSKARVSLRAARQVPGNGAPAA